MKKPKKGALSPTTLSATLSKAAEKRPLRTVTDFDDESLRVEYNRKGVVMELGGVLPDALQMFEDHVLSDDERAWLRLVDALDLALLHPGITSNPAAAEFCHLMRELACRARDSSTVDDVLAPLRAALVSKQTSTAAKSKNAEARAWVIEQWKSRADMAQGKAAFGRQYALLVKSKYRLDVTPETISRDWLPKA